MAYNHGREDRKWRIWKQVEEKVLQSEHDSIGKEQTKTATKLAYAEVMAKRTAKNSVFLDLLQNKS